MPQPFSNTYTHIDQYLSNLAVGFMADPGDFHADEIFPPVNVDKQSNKYPIFDAAALARIHAGIRARATAARRSGYTVSNDSYFSDNIALAHEMPFESLQNADFNLDRGAIRFIAEQIKLSKEQLVLSKVSKLTSWGTLTDHAGVASGATSAALTYNEWHIAGTTPVADIFDLKRKIKARCRRMPNELILAADVADILVNHADIKARFNYVVAGTLTYDDLTTVFFPKKDGVVIVPEANYNTAAEGQTASYSNLFPNGYVWLGYVNPTPDASGEVPSAGYQFVWRPFGGDAGGVYILPPKDENDAGSRHIRIYEGGYFADAKIVSADCGALITGILG